MSLLTIEQITELEGELLELPFVVDVNISEIDQGEVKYFVDVKVTNYNIKVDKEVKSKVVRFQIDNQLFGIGFRIRIEPITNTENKERGN